MLLYAPNWLFIRPGGLLMCAGLFLTCWLLPGPRKIPHNVVLDVHTMIFGVIFTLMGAQILAIGAFAKVFSYAERFRPQHRVAETNLERVTFDPVCCWAARCSWVACRMLVHRLEVGGERIWTAATGARSAVLVDVAVPGVQRLFFRRFF